MNKKIYTLNEFKESRIFFDKNPPKYMMWLIGFILVIICLLLIWSIFAPKVDVEKVKGMVVSKDFTNIAPEIQGTVEQVFLNEGDTVKSGDIVLVLKGDTQDIQVDTSKQQKSNLEGQVENYNKYEKSIKSGVNLFSQNNAGQLEFYNNVEYYITQVKSYNDDINSYKYKIKELQTQILKDKSKEESATSEIEQNKESIKRTESSKESLKIQILAQIGQKRNELETQLIDAKGKYNANSEYQNNYVIKALSDGVIHYNYEIKAGSVLQAATPIGRIFNDDEKKLSLQVLLPANERSKVNIGDDVEIALDGVLQTKFGVIEGKLNEINVDSSVNEKSGEIYFISYVKPLKLFVEDKKGSKIILKSGMTSDVRIKYKENTWAEWLLEQINITL